jgi:hypothetical protein
VIGVDGNHNDSGLEMEDGRRAPAIDRMTPDERAIFVRCLARIVLNRVLHDIEAEQAAEQTQPESRDTSAS